MAQITVKNAAGTDIAIEAPNANGRAAAASSRPVALSTEDKTALDAIKTAAEAATPAGEQHIGAVGGHSAVVTGQVVRPADTTAYAIGDLVANSVTAGAVTPVALAAARVNAGTGCIRRVRLTTTKTGLAGTDVFRVHLFKIAPTATNGDNGVFSVNGVAAIHLGIVDVTLDRAFTDGTKGIGVPAMGGEITFDAAAGSANLYALIEARSAYTPASGETFTIALEVFRD